jgi:Protein of unknown function (DUF1570)
MLFVAALLAVLPSAGDAYANLDFRAASLAQWQGDGFYLTSATGHGPSLSFAVCSSDCGRQGRKALLYRTFVVPPNIGAIRFHAAAVRRSGCTADQRLDVVLEAAERRFRPKQVRTDSGWEAAPQLLPLTSGKPREYQWNVADLAGQTIRLALLDEDDRPGCFVFCSGFRLVSRDEVNGREFTELMRKLTQDHKLSPMVRIDSKHFMAVGNADDEFIEERLYNCETIYDIFFQHFRKKGFTMREPKGRLMVAVFDTQAGFEAYLGHPMSTAVRGLYDTPTNRLVVYDFGQNRAFLDTKARGDQEARRVPTSLDRQRVISSFNRRAQDYRTDANIGTVMHEVAHQLSFNSGLLNRDGDVAVWLAEGLACYCESTNNGGWQGIGEPNSNRAATLAAALRAKAAFIPLRELVESDDWIRQASNTNQVVLGYAQSWALFSLLMEERPKDMKKYLALIYPRRTPEQRLADFTQVFGTDLAKWEKRYQGYLRDVAATQARPER